MIEDKEHILPRYLYTSIEKNRNMVTNWTGSLFLIVDSQMIVDRDISSLTISILKSSIRKRQKTRSLIGLCPYLNSIDSQMVVANSILLLKKTETWSLIGLGPYLNSILTNDGLGWRLS